MVDACARRPSSCIRRNAAGTQPTQRQRQASRHRKHDRQSPGRCNNATEPRPGKHADGVNGLMQAHGRVALLAIDMADAHPHPYRVANALAKANQDLHHKDTPEHVGESCATNTNPE